MSQFNRKPAMTLRMIAAAGALLIAGFAGSAQAAVHPLAPVQSAVETVLAHGHANPFKQAPADPTTFFQPAAPVAPSAIYGIGPSGHLPDPTAWAMMLAGMAGAGTALRRRRADVYRLVERLPNDRTLVEEFSAPDTDEALARAHAVAEGPFELWQGGARVYPG